MLTWTRGPTQYRENQRRGLCIREERRWSGRCLASASLLDVCVWGFFLYLCEIFKTAANQRVGAAVGRHLHGVLDESEQLHRQLVDVEDVAEDHLHVLHTDTALRC